MGFSFEALAVSAPLFTSVEEARKSPMPVMNGGKTHGQDCAPKFYSQKQVRGWTSCLFCSR